MTINPDVIDSLKSLSCFTEIREVSLLTGGLSQTCVKVITSTQLFFAKKLNNETADGEVNAAITAAEQGISPNVIYHDRHWLVTEFVNGMTLARAELNVDAKISIALKLMARCHHLSISKHEQSIPSLDTRQSVNALLVNPASFLPLQRDILDKLTSTLTDTIDSLICKTESLSVLCHGDVNFTNILLGKNQRSWLIDFECAHRAPVEFDLAMLIAVNDLPVDNQKKIVDEYTTLVPRECINLALLDHYILYSFYINGLWYLDNGLRSHAVTQWSAFDKFVSKQSLNLEKLMTLIS